MPMDFTEPAPNGPFGPGFSFLIGSSFIGPLASGSSFGLELQRTTDEVTIESIYSIPTQNPFIQGIWPFTEVTSRWDSAPAKAGKIHGDNMLLKSTLYGPDLSVLDSGTTTIQYDAVSGIPYQIAQLLNAQTSTETPVYMGAIQSDINEIRAASFAEFGSPSQLIPVSSLLSHPPLGFLRRELIGDFTGEGVIDNPGGIDRLNRFGIAWEILSAGQDLGINEGAPDTIELPVLDLQTVHLLADGNAEDSNRVSVNFGDSMWLFEPMLPSSVRYWILPSVEIRLYWLVIVS